MDHDPTPSDVDALLTTMLEMEEVVGAAAHDERGNVIASVGGPRSRDVLTLDVPLRLGVKKKP